MLGVELCESANTLTLRLEGRFVAEFADYIRSLFLHHTIPSILVIDLSGITYIDGAGEETLKWLEAIGGQFIAGNCYSLYICQGLHLPVV